MRCQRPLPRSLPTSSSLDRAKRCVILRPSGGVSPALADWARWHAQGDNGQDAVDEKGQVIYSDDELPSEDDEDAGEMSKRKQRKLNRLSVAELKRLVKKPEVVDWVDVSASDPRLLVEIKSHRNTVPIPQHWSQKSAYLAGKRGIEKPPYQLPSASFVPLAFLFVRAAPTHPLVLPTHVGFIADTGIATQRDAVKEKEDQQSLKQKTRERVQPKMGKIDIDYQKLHDAFFKYQTKPKMTEFGEVCGVPPPSLVKARSF